MGKQQNTKKAKRAVDSLLCLKIETNHFGQTKGKLLIRSKTKIQISWILQNSQK